MLRLAILVSVAAMLVASAALAAGCPPGTKRHCLQTRSGVQCYCR
jgi:hypothetical protein